MFLEFGVDPRAMDTMSLYEIISMQVAHGKRGKPQVSDKEFEEGQALLRERLGNDPSVRL